ncbi:MAG: GNAT family N-acetyltransferase [Actinomycetota bacterium]|jgi:GNAT superfamily N-acetyltransferase|nr:GNAT family N-acetyltransferase [Actinomycetota bacterium]
MDVREVGAEATHDLRRRVLRQGHPEAEVRFDGDDAPGSFHLAVVDQEGRPLAVATAVPAPTPRRPGRRAWRLRGMAVEPALQGRGLGSRLLEAVVARAEAGGAEVVWAAGRDSALDFYRGRGWSVEGEGYLDAGDLPHHTVVLDLAQGRARSVSGDGPQGRAGSPPRRPDPSGHQQP